MMKLGMAEEWNCIPLGEFVTLQRGHDLPDEKRRRGNVPILGSFGVTGWHDASKTRGPGVTIGRSGASFGVVSYSKCDYWPLNTTLYVTDFHGNDERFAYYFLKQFDFRGYNSGSAQPSLNRNFIHPVPVEIPPKDEQRAIGHILGTLDDKIELNRRMSETLEAIARALFKSWFVDFDPVRAKAEGRDPGLPNEIADLFPSRLVDSELGEIPEGWQTKRVSEYMSFAYGKSLPAGKRGYGNIPVYGSGGITGAHNEALIHGPAVIVGRKGTVGSLYWEDRPCFPIDTVFYVQPEAPLPFCYYLLENLPLRNMNTDAAVPGLNRGNVCRLEVAGPPDELVSAFAETAVCFRKSIAAISRESDTLTQLRDTLLPKLISGELSITDAEKIRV